MPQDTAAVVLAAGAGRRLGAKGVHGKAFVALAGRPLLAWSVEALRAAPSIAQILAVLPAGASAAQDAARACGADLAVAGGAERWLSSRAGAHAADPALPLLIVHDAARPLVRPEEVERLIAAVRAHGAALLAEPLADTLKEADDAQRVRRTLPRAGLWRAQTPQGARRDWLLAAFAAWDARRDGLPTDESSLLERAGRAPALVEARAPNPKITYPQDLAAAEALLAGRRA